MKIFENIQNEFSKYYHTNFQNITNYEYHITLNKSMVFGKTTTKFTLEFGILPPRCIHTPILQLQPVPDASFMNNNRYNRGKKCFIYSQTMDEIGKSRFQ